MLKFRSERFTFVACRIIVVYLRASVSIWLHEWDPVGRTKCGQPSSLLCTLYGVQAEKTEKGAWDAQ